jgi:hypothetical protein
MKTVLLAVAVTLAGCATRPGVVPASDGTLTAMRRGTELSASTGPLRLQALKDADDYCSARRKRVNVIWSREIPAISHWPEAEVSFVCE